MSSKGSKEKGREKLEKLRVWEMKERVIKTKRQNRRNVKSGRGEQA
jgi:hypothetical protein